MLEMVCNRAASKAWGNGRSESSFISIDAVGGTLWGLFWGVNSFVLCWLDGSTPWICLPAQAGFLSRICLFLTLSNT